jgi:hypothetical protein
MGEWVVPVEEETGIPLAIMPNEDGLPLPGMKGEGADWHHLVYPRSRQELKTKSGLAIRHLRLEWIDVDDHVSFHHYFNEYMTEKWEFPKSIHHRFGMGVLMAARYVPPRAIKIAREGPSYATLGERTRRRMWSEGILRIERDVKVYEFLRDYILDQDLKELVDEDDVDTFLHTPDPIIRNKKGDDLLAAAARAATADIQPVYMDAYKKRLIAPEVSNEPGEFIISEPFILGTEKRMRRARHALRKVLANQYGVELAEAC